VNASFLHACYHPALVLGAGTLCFFGFMAAGGAVARKLGHSLPAPWSWVLAPLLGIQCASLLVELGGMAGVATQPVLVALALMLIAAGCVHVVRHARGFGVELMMAAKGGGVTLSVLAGAALAANLAVALAPSSKIDEIYYHMLVPARLAAEGALSFYREPWEGAFLPHMAFQLALAPLHALRVPDAGNVVGWWIGATLAAFAWKLVRDRGGDPHLPLLWAAGISAGLYPVVWHVTSGSHAMVDVAACAALLAWLMRAELVANAGARTFAFLVSVLALGAASGKATMLPLALLLVAMTGTWLHRSGGLRGAVALRPLAGPWIVFYLPIVAWTTWTSGFDVAGSEARQILSDVRDANMPTLSSLAFDVLTGYTPLVWLGALALLGSPIVLPRERLGAAGLFLVQCAVIVLLAYPAVRFLGGVHYALALGFAVLCAEPLRRYAAGMRRWGFIALALALTGPWVGAHLYYAAQFMPVAAGFQPRADFCERYVALYRDFVALDRMLPNDAVLLIDLRAGSVYAPRPAFTDAADLPRGRPAFLLYDVSEPPAMGHGPYKGLEAGETVYRNDEAVIEAYRTPGRESRVGPVQVVRLVPSVQ
jgi:hypothetical protein